MENQDLLAELEQMRADLARVTTERDLAIQDLAEWAYAVDIGGVEWENWDEYYKSARFPEERNSIISYLLLSEKKRLGEDAAAPYSVVCRGCGVGIVVRMDNPTCNEWCQLCVDDKKAPRWMTSGADTVYSKGDDT